MFDQAQSRGIRVRSQALIREGGSKAAAALSCYSTGSPALGLLLQQCQQEVSPMPREAPGVRRSTLSPPHRF